VAHVDGDGYRVYEHPGGREDGGTVKNVHFINNTVTDSSHENGGGLRVNHGSASGIVMRNKIAWNNVDYDIRPGAGTHTESNLCGDSLCEIQELPQFIDPQNDDFRLAATSPAIDVGLFLGAPAFDITGVARPQGAAPDLGAAEFLPPGSGDPGPDSDFAPDSTAIPDSETSSRVTEVNTSGGCSLSVSPVTPIQAGEWWLLFGFLSWLGWWRRRWIGLQPG
jgi:hypothetical protein